MERTSSIKKTAPAPAPRHFDWFMGLLYLMGAVGFALIAALFFMLLNVQ